MTYGINNDLQSFEAQCSCNRNYWPTKEWKTSLSSEHGFDKELLDKLEKVIKEKDILSMIIVKDGYIVSEYYKEGQNSDTLFQLNSCTKSITSSLVGIAIDKSYIKGVNQNISDFFQKINYADVDSRKKKMTIENLLDATSGISWPELTEEWNYTPEPMVNSEDWVDFILARPMSNEPGKVFNYNTGGSHLLSAIIQKTTGKDAFIFGLENIFEKIGMRSVEWPKDPSGINTGGHGIKMTARDAAKFGFLYLNKGKWDGKQIIPEKWVIESTKQHSEGIISLYGNYGYQWWIRTLKADKEYKAYFAIGYAGQYISVVPDLDLVVVFTSWLPNGVDLCTPINYIESYIIKSLEKQ